MVGLSKKMYGFYWATLYITFYVDKSYIFDLLCKICPYKISYQRVNTSYFLMVISCTKTLRGDILTFILRTVENVLVCLTAAHLIFKVRLINALYHYHYHYIAMFYLTLCHLRGGFCIRLSQRNL